MITIIIIVIYSFDRGRQREALYTHTYTFLYTLLNQSAVQVARALVEDEHHVLPVCQVLEHPPRALHRGTLSTHRGTRSTHRGTRSTHRALAVHHVLPSTRFSRAALRAHALGALRVLSLPLYSRYTRGSPAHSAGLLHVRSGGTRLLVKLFLVREPHACARSHGVLRVLRVLRVIPLGVRAAARTGYSEYSHSGVHVVAWGGRPHAMPAAWHRCIGVFVWTRLIATIATANGDAADAEDGRDGMGRDGTGLNGLLDLARSSDAL